MNFFKSILSDDEDLPEPQIRPESDPNSPLEPSRDESDSNGVADGWSFGGLIKTLAAQSESVIETYRRDLKEFGSGLRKETEILRETASQAVKDLPASLEAAHGALDGVLKSTANIISKESLGFSSDGESETPGTNRSLNSGRYSRFEAQLSAIQSDLNAFCEEPEDVEDYGKWKLGFELEDFRGEIESLIGENGILQGGYKRAVPSAVDHETFWCRYFYRVDKLKQQESLRANLVKRVISVDDEEELSWDVDDDEYDEDGSERGGGLHAKVGDGKGDHVVSDGNSDPVENSVSGEELEGGNVDVTDGDKSYLVESSKTSSAGVSLGEKEEKPEALAEVKRVEKVNSEGSIKDSNDDKMGVEEKGESGTKSDASVVSSHQNKMVVGEEDDMGWDEIEDIGSSDEKKISATACGGSPKKADLPKRLSAAKDDDELSWDIEDDDEPVKA